jgi:uncharacterized membrane-anchored protein YitT (DUF2179 family)
MRINFKTLMIDYLFINLGLISAAVGIGLFIVPANLVVGGATGIATILKEGMNLSIGTILLVINIPLYLIGVINFGKSYGIKTLYSIFMLSFFIDFFRSMIGAETIVDFSKGGNFLLAPLFGGILVGAGTGLILKFGSSTGGTDILVQLQHKYLKVPLGYCMMLTDTTIIAGGVYFFGIEKGLYAIIAMFTISTLVQKIFNGGGNTKMVYIISTQQKEIQMMITSTLNSGGTLIHSKGLFTNEKRNIIMTVIRNREVRKLRSFIKQIDPNAFVIVSEVQEVLGEGFGSLK